MHGKGKATRWLVSSVLASAIHIICYVNRFGEKNERKNVCSEHMISSHVEELEGD